MIDTHQNNYPYHCIGQSGILTITAQVRSITLMIDGRRPNTGFGIVKIDLRTGSNTNQASVCNAEWIVRNTALPVDVIQIGFRDITGDCFCDIFIKSPNTYRNYVCKVLSQGYGNNMSDAFVLQNATEVNNTTVNNKLTSTNVYQTIVDANTDLHENKSYTSVITPA